MIYLCNADMDWRYMQNPKNRSQSLLTPEELNYYESSCVIVELPDHPLWLEPLEEHNADYRNIQRLDAIR